MRCSERSCILGTKLDNTVVTPCKRSEGKYVEAPHNKRFAERVWEALQHKCSDCLTVQTAPTNLTKREVSTRRRITRQLTSGGRTALVFLVYMARMSNRTRDSPPAGGIEVVEGEVGLGSALRPSSAEVATPSPSTSADCTSAAIRRVSSAKCLSSESSLSPRCNLMKT